MARQKGLRSSFFLMGGGGKKNSRRSDVDQAPSKKSDPSDIILECSYSVFWMRGGVLCRDVLGERRFLLAIYKKDKRGGVCANAFEY